MADTEDPFRRTDPRADASRPYGSRDTQLYDLWLPGEADARGVTVVLVHGGFWRAIWDRAHLAPLAAALRADGYHVAVLEYARAGMPGGGWPGTGDDIRAGIDGIRTDSVLPQRIVLVGHSAGGHLVCWAASQPWADGIRGVVPLAGCLDLVEIDRLGLDDAAAADFMGGHAIELTAAYAEADPAQLRLRLPAVLIHGTDDERVPLSISQRYLGTRGATDATARLDVIEGSGHFELIDPEDPTAYPLLRAAVAELAP